MKSIHIHSMASIVASLAAFPATPAEFSGVPVNYSMIPQEIIKPIPIEITTDEFIARLKSGGTLTLDGNVLVIAPPNSNKKAIAFMALDRLELKNGAKIVTNGNTLVLFANTLASEKGSIVSYEVADTKAGDGKASSGAGADGNAGNAGLSGGVVSLHVIKTIDGHLAVDLRGQDGGIGSDGQKGGQPPEAGRGEDAQDGPGGWLTPGWCKKGGGNGQPGKQGYQGGTAGVGGVGGDGGYFELINVGKSPIPAASYSFTAKAGGPGKTGNPGPGGDGGIGGDGGHGSTWCSGGKRGPTGPQGLPGPIPDPARGGADGTSAVKNLDLEVMIRTSVIVPSAPKP